MTWETIVPVNPLWHGKPLFQSTHDTGNYCSSQPMTRETIVPVNPWHGKLLFQSTHDTGNHCSSQPMTRETIVTVNPLWHGKLFFQSTPYDTGNHCPSQPMKRETIVFQMNSNYASIKCLWLNTKRIKCHKFYCFLAEISIHSWFFYWQNNAMFHIFFHFRCFWSFFSQIFYFIDCFFIIDVFLL